MRWIAVIVLGGLCSCSIVKEWAMDAGKQAATEYMEAQVFSQAPELKAAADTDQSGSVSWDELKVWLSGGGLLALVSWYLRRKGAVEVKAVEDRLKQKTGDLYGELAKMKFPNG